MLVAKIENGVVIDVLHYQNMFPNTSFTDAGPDTDFLTERGCVVVSLTKPCNRDTQKLVTTDWYLENGVVYNVVVEQKTEAELAADLAMLKTAKNTEINSWRLQANRGTFTHGGKVFSCDELSRSDIDGVTSSVTLTGALPANWPGAWKAVDNTYHLIQTVDDWKAFVASMVESGTENFIRSQILKNTLATATTKEQIEAIVW